MIFEYNEDKDFTDRVKQVTLEIVMQYPLIDVEAAKQAAIQSPSIDDKPTSSDKFLRYYYILLNLNALNDEYLHVFNDMYDLYEEGLDNPLHERCMEEIIKYISGERDIFPRIGDFVE